MKNFILFAFVILGYTISLKYETNPYHCLAAFFISIGTAIYYFRKMIDRVKNGLLFLSFSRNSKINTEDTEQIVINEIHYQILSVMLCIPLFIVSIHKFFVLI